MLDVNLIWFERCGYLEHEVFVSGVGSTGNLR